MLKDDELVGKYIKYSPEISGEIFYKIIKYLCNKGYELYNHCNLGTKYQDFIKEKYLNISCRYIGKAFAIDNNPQGCTEISYKDIIGEEEWWKDLKKGDYVVCIKDNLIVATKNFIYEVNYVDSDNWISHEQENGISNGYRYNNYRLASPEEKAMYISAGKPVNVTTYKLPKEVQTAKGESIYFPDMSKHIGRYIKALIDYPNGGKVKAGEIGVIVNKGNVDFPSQKEYACDALLEYNNKKYELMPESYVPETKGEFILPEKWCFKGSKESEKFQKNVLENETNVAFMSPYYYWHNPSKDYKDKEWKVDNTIPQGYTEITFEQFKKYVFEEASKKNNMEEILLEAKRRFPIGCKFYPILENGTLSNMIHTQRRECYIFDDEWIIGSANIRNAMGDWAKVISSPEEEKITNQPFKAGDKLVGKSTGGNNIITHSDNVNKNYLIPDKVEYTENNRVKLWLAESYWNCDISDISLYQEKEEDYNSTDYFTKPWIEHTGIQVKSEQRYYCGVDPCYLPEKPELILKDENEPVIFPNIKRERIVEIKIKLVD